MTLQDLGSLGEFVAAIATLLTLLYLAIQIRENTAASRRAALDEYVDRLSRWSTSLRDNPDSFEVYMKGNRDYYSMNANEKLKYHFIMSQLFSYFESALGHGKVGGLKQETKAGTHDLIIRHLSQAGAMQWWQKTGEDYVASDFAEFVEELLERAPLPPNKSIKKDAAGGASS